MADPTQFEFSLEELTKILIKHQGIHEGLWMLGFEFGFGAMHMGLNPTDVKPAAFIQVNKLQLTKPAEGTPVDSNLIFDAAKINPAPAAKKAPKKTAL